MNIVELAQALTVAWLLEDRGGEFPTPAVLRAAILAGWDSRPDGVRDLLHISARIDGDHIREETDIVWNVGRSGMLDQSYTYIQISLLDAMDRLKDMRLDWPTEVAWCRTIFRNPAASVAA